MSESSDTSAIDEKKKESTSSNKGDFFSSIGGFITLVVIIFVSIIVYYTGSGLILYACKLAQSNILPTDAHCSPYTDLPPDIESIETNIFTTEGDEPSSLKSMKLKFPYDEYNKKNYILDMFREYKKEPRSNFLANYLISVIEEIMRFNYWAFNTILNMLNGLPEILVVIFGPVIFAFISTLILIGDNLYLIYLLFARMGWFFKTNTNDSGTGNPKWKDVTFGSPFSYLASIWLVISFSILFCVLFFFPLTNVVVSSLVLLLMLWCLFSCFSYKAEMGGKTISTLQIIRDVFKYYKSTITGIFSFYVIVSAFSYLGTIPGFFSIMVSQLYYLT